MQVSGRQMIFLALLGVLGFVTYISAHDDRARWLALAIVVVGGVAAIYPGPDVAHFAGVGDLIRRARDGHRLAAPPNASSQMARAYDELNAWTEESRNTSAAESAQRKELVQVAARLAERVERLQKELASEASTLRDLSQANKHGTNHLEALDETLARTQVAARDMDRAGEDVTTSLKELMTNVERTAEGIEAMSSSIKEVARSVDGLARATEDTSSSMTEIDVSIDQVRSNANETARLSEEMAHDAERGAETIQKTISEIFHIKDISQEALNAISTLGTRIDAIGQIVNVIDDVAEQTNLLALNAAIIAAQAGEQGKGFAVVADEIKDLADRAGASTREITDLIKTVQAESRNAITAVQRGASTVDRGVQVSSEAERVLKRILEGSQKSTTMIRAIARATEEQSKGSKHVTDAIGRIAETVQQIAHSTSQQAKSGDTVLRVAERTRATTERVHRAAITQAERGRDMVGNVRASADAATRLRDSQKESTENVRVLVTMSTERSESTMAQLASIKELTVSVEKMRNAG